MADNKAEAGTEEKKEKSNLRELPSGKLRNQKSLESLRIKLMPEIELIQLSRRTTWAVQLATMMSWICLS